MAKLLSGTRIYGTANVDTQINVGANVVLTTTNISVGNSTVNASIGATAITSNATLGIGNTTVTGFIDVSSYGTFNGTVNATSLNIGANISITTTSIKVGNTTQNTAFSSNNIILNGTLTANNSNGSAAYVLTSSGATGNVYWAAGGGGGSFATTVLNDISNLFDFRTCVFPLRLEQSDITSSNFTDSKDLDVVINGLKLTPYVKQITYPWLTPYDSHRGFRAVATSTDANVIIYNAPAIGDSVSVTMINNSSSIQTRKYPYSATTIALGD